MVMLSYAKGDNLSSECMPVTLRVMTLPDRKMKVLARLTGGRGVIDSP